MELLSSFLLTYIHFSKCQKFLFQKVLSLWSHFHIHFKTFPKGLSLQQMPSTGTGRPCSESPPLSHRQESLKNPASSLTAWPPAHSSSSRTHLRPGFLADLLSPSLLPFPSSLFSPTPGLPIHSYTGSLPMSLLSPFIQSPCFIFQPTSSLRKDFRPFPQLQELLI